MRDVYENRSRKYIGITGRKENQSVRVCLGNESMV
jgi:hypothetical protein